MSDPSNTMRDMRSEKQHSFDFPTRGGRREKAGRKTDRPRRAIPHRPREEFRPYQPVHVTFRMAEWVWNLRSERSFCAIHGALDELRRRSDVRAIEFSIQGNHVHLVVEADGPRALANGMRAFAIRLARRLNRMMGRSGPVLEDRYHAHVLRTPAEVRNALRYVRGNFASHAARRGEQVSPRWVDPYTSQVVRAPRNPQAALWAERVTSRPETWLLRNGESLKAHGLSGRAAALPR
jgi:REP element-mobilizing transposase RayT